LIFPAFLIHQGLMYGHDKALNAHSNVLMLDC
jgi:hypothetical protein